MQTESLEKGVAFIGGQLVPISEAKIPILDWGFLHSDATYDVAHLWKGKFFRLEDHINRFFAGMKSLHMDIGMTRLQVKQAMIDCVKATGLEDAYVEIICTRGQPKPGSRDPRTCQNQFWVFAIPFVYILEPGKKGLSVIISQRQRIPVASLDPRIKNYHWLDLVLGLYEAYDRGAESVLLVDEQGYLCEGPGFNVFIVKGKSLLTPGSGVLQGITRQTILELAPTLGLQAEEGAITEAMAKGADEVFVTSTAGGVIPVICLNGEPVNEGEPGKVTQRLSEAYWGLHDEPQHSLAVI
ncbi:aminotransferase class IV [SAR92 clade bacterium H231]|nr:aminotransferase class IV [SAR92 clade bacterium H231]